MASPDSSHAVKKSFSDLSQPIKDFDHKLKRSLAAKPSPFKLQEFAKKFLNLNRKIPPVNNMSSENFDVQQTSEANPSNDLPNLHMSHQFKQSSYFQEFQVIFEGFDIRTRLCLLCFAVFPENAVVNKRLLVYWWIGEGLLDHHNTSAEKTAEEIAYDIIQDFVVHRFIHPVHRKGRKDVKSFKMYSTVRSTVIMLAHENGFFNYNAKGNPTSNFSPWCNRACLVNDKEGSTPLESENGTKLKTLFNVSEQFPDFTFEWFSKLKFIKVLYLGRWQSSAEHTHIEVENGDFLKGLKYMQELRLLSLQGIFGIQELPKSISKLKSLRILDLRACYSLQKLPKEVASLEMLTHLDISECYLLDHMPKELSSLSQLQVLKGFVIGDASDKQGNFCALSDLAKLTNLRKLSIIVHSEAFSIEELFSTLSKFKVLRKLKLIWGGGSSQAKPDEKTKQADAKSKATIQESSVDNEKQENDASKPTLTNQDKNKDGKEQDGWTPKRNRDKQNVGVTKPAASVIRRSLSKLTYTGTMNTKPLNLEKLDVLCFPHEALPSWLIPQHLKKLQKLYIRGGRLNSLALPKLGNGHEKWTEVKVLRLRYLYELKMNWRELQASFPNLEYLEKFKCPKLAFCPCDGYGVWVR